MHTAAENLCGADPASEAARARELEVWEPGALRGKTRDETKVLEMKGVRPASVERRLAGEPQKE